MFTAGTDDAHVIDIAPSHQNSTFSSLIIEFCICANTSVMQDNICSPFSLNNIRYGVHFVSIFDMKFQFRFDPLKKFFYWNENEHFQLKSNVQPILDASITGYATYISNYAYIQNLVVHMNWVGLVYVFGLLDYVKFGCSYQFWCSHQFGVLYQFVLYQFGFSHQFKICISNELNEELPQECHHSYAAVS